MPDFSIGLKDANQIVHSIADSAILIDNNGIIVAINDSFSKMLNCDGEIAGQHIHNIIYFGSHDYFDHYIQSSVKTNKTQECTIRISGKKITEKRVKITLTPIKIDNDMTLLLLLFMDSRVIKSRKESQITESFYRQLLEDSIQGIALIQDERYIYVNQSLANILEYSVDELLAFSTEQIWSLVHPDDLEGLKSRNVVMSEGGRLPRHRFRYISKSGKVKWVDSFVKQVIYNNRLATQVVEIDITDEIETRLALESYEKQLRTIIDSIDDIIFVYNENNEYVEVFTSNTDIVLGEPNEIIGKSVYENLPKHLANLIVESLNKVRKTGERVSIDYPLTINGKSYWFSALFTLHEDGKNVVAVVREITERHRMELAIKEREEQFAKFAEHMPGLVCILDLNDRIIYMNKKMMRTFRVSDWQSKRIQELNSEELVKAIKIQKEIIDDKPYIDTRAIIDHNGKQRKLKTYIFKISVPDDEPLIGFIGIDVTQVSQIEDALRESEMMYRMLFENAPVAIIMTDIEGNIIASNKLNLEMFGYTWDELRFLNARNLYANPAERNIALHELRINNELRNHEIVLRKKDGTEFPVLLDEHFLKIGNRDVIVAMIRNISDIKQATQALIESEKRYRLLFEAAPVAVGMVSFNGDFLDANSMLLDLLGHTKESIREVNANAFYNDPKIKKTLTQLLKENGEVRNFELDIKTASGEDLTILVNINMVNIDDQNVLFASVNDITYLRKTEAKILKYSSLLESIYDAIPDPVISINNEFIIKKCNRAFEFVFGYNSDELVGKRCGALLADSSLELMGELKEKLQLTESLTFHEFLFKRKDGDIFPGSFSMASIRDNDNRRLGFVGLIHDETESLAASREIITTRDRAMLYLDLMSHDISNQLQIIIGATQLSRVTESQSKMNYLLDMIEDAALKCTNIISRLTSIRKLAESPLRLTDLVLELEDIIDEFAFKFSDIKINVSLPDASCNIYADEFLEVVLFNILENAVIHNPYPEWDREVWVSIVPNSQGFTVVISDNGPGIPNSQKEKILDMSQRYGGLGLHIAKQIIEKYGGRLTIKDRIPNKSSEGASFEIWFPKSTLRFV